MRWLYVTAGPLSGKQFIPLEVCRRRSSSRACRLPSGRGARGGSVGGAVFCGPGDPVTGQDQHDIVFHWVRGSKLPAGHQCAT